jgi:hypothetical protein
MEKIRESVILRGVRVTWVNQCAQRCVREPLHLTRLQISDANFREPKLGLHPKH